MFFILKLVLIILLNEAKVYIMQDTETIILPALNPIDVKEIPLTLKVFGQLIQLNLSKNHRIVSPEFKIWKNNRESVTEKCLQSNVSDPCYYYHKDQISSAVINFCHEYGLEGLVFVKNDRLEIRPLENEFTSLYLIDDFREQTNFSFGKAHVIKRTLQYFVDSNSYHWDKFKLKRREIRINAQKNLIIRLAVFYDKAVYQTIMPLVNNDKKEFLHTILPYVNLIRTAFKHKSLNAFINILVIRLSTVEEVPLNVSIVYNNIDLTLSTFCKYADYLNPPDDRDPRNWDIALLLTGEDLFEIIQLYSFSNYGKSRFFNYGKTYSIIGKTYFDGVCKPLSSCAVVEFRKIRPSFNPTRLINYLLGLKQHSRDSGEYYYTDSPTNYDMIIWSDNSSKQIETLWERKICLRDHTQYLDDDDTRKNLTIKLAVFLDHQAYVTFMPLLDNDKEKLRNMILAYVNQIQAVFHHPSLGTSINIMLVHLDIMEEQPACLQTFGNVNNVLDMFCTYANSLNPSENNNTRHWDVSLYLTGLKLYETADRKTPYLRADNVVTYLGTKVTYVNEMCNPIFSCAILEFGHVEGLFSGFASSVDAVHLIGHLLGLEFDKDPFESYNYMNDINITVMSPYRYFWGYVTWSERSRNQIEKLWERKPCLRDNARSENLDDAHAFDHLHYGNLPGREWTAKAQCELYVGDKNANVITLHDICQSLQCEAPHRNKSYFAGPALDGTSCAKGKECREGKCVPVIEPPYIFKICEDDNWSEWKEDSCKSNCLSEGLSKGVVIKRRSCKHGTDRATNCIEPYYDVVLCDDSLLCTEPRKTFVEFLTMKCTEFSDIIPEVIPEPGWQGLYDIDRPWIACTIICNRMDRFAPFPFYTHYGRMVANGINPYFPDGAWCHSDRNQNYFCRKHHCLPENHTFVVFSKKNN